MNARVLEWFQAVADNDTDTAEAIARSLPEEERFPFVILLAHRGLDWFRHLVGDDWLVHLKIAATEARMIADEHQEQP